METGPKNIDAILSHNVPTARELVKAMEDSYEVNGRAMLFASEWLSAKEKEGVK